MQTVQAAGFGKSERPGHQLSFVAALLHLRLCHAIIIVLAATAAAAVRWLMPAAARPLAGLEVIAATGALLAMGTVTLLAWTVRRRPHWLDPDTGLYGKPALTALDGPLRRKTRRRGEPLTLLALELRTILEYRRRSEHAAANELARVTARQLRHIAGPGGFAFRIGSAQFLCVLPGRLREQTLRILRESMGSPCRIGFEAGETRLVTWPAYRISTLHSGEDLLEACRRTFRELGRPPVPAGGWDRLRDAEVATIPMPLQASAGPAPRAQAGRLPVSGRW